jgi:hypothetical protein
MVVVERLFRPSGSSLPHDDASPRPLSNFFNKPAVVVLGEPGAGKTTSFQQATKAEPNAGYWSVRDFITLNIERFRGKTLYIDGLDELRSRTTDGRTVLDEVRSRLDNLGCPPFRLSCRAADWFGASDTKALEKVSSDGEITGLSLEPLSEDDILRITGAKVTDPNAFIDGARDRNVFGPSRQSSNAWINVGHRPKRLMARDAVGIIRPSMSDARKGVKRGAFILGWKHVWHRTDP